MLPAARLKLLLLLLVPALALPRGVELAWCLCPDRAAECCVECCGPAGETDVDPAGADCCKSIEVDDFEEWVPSDEAPALPPLLAAPDARATAVLRPATLRGRRGVGRAPPHVTPPGLLPGVAPLLL